MFNLEFLNSFCELDEKHIDKIKFSLLILTHIARILLDYNYCMRHKLLY